mmetsp:Transcript_28292/g.52104  ORF Transcript_28292/g.52104 Transcript_28292/m.52104 type:complete len:226 (-) Transcript_28292:289-966(-)
MEVDQRENLLLGRLEERVLDVPVHHIQDFISGGGVPESVLAGLQRARQFLATPGKRRTHPHIAQRVRALAAHQFLLRHQRGALCLLLHGGAEQAKIANHLVGVFHVVGSEREFLDERLGGESYEGLEGRALLERDADDGAVAVGRVAGHTHIADDADMERHEHAVQRQQYRLGVLIELDDGAEAEGSGLGLDVLHGAVHVDFADAAGVIATAAYTAPTQSLVPGR